MTKITEAQRGQAVAREHTARRSLVLDAGQGCARRAGCLLLWSPPLDLSFSVLSRCAYSPAPRNRPCHSSDGFGEAFAMRSTGSAPLKPTAPPELGRPGWRRNPGLWSSPRLCRLVIWGPLRTRGRAGPSEAGRGGCSARWQGGDRQAVRTVLRGTRVSGGEGVRPGRGQRAASTPGNPGRGMGRCHVEIRRGQPRSFSWKRGRRCPCGAGSRGAGRQGDS